MIYQTFPRMNRLPALLAAAALAFIPSLHADDAAIRKACVTQVRELYSLNLAYAHRNGGQFAKSFDAIFAAEKKADKKEKTKKNSIELNLV